MGQRAIRALGPILLAVLALGASGCGGGGSKNTAATTTEAAATTKAAITAPATTQAATTSDLSGIASAANCKELADLGTRFSQAMSGTDTQNAKKVAQLLQEFAAKTPADIRPDFKVVADAYSKVADAVGNITPGAVPDAATLAKLTKLATEIDSAKLSQASLNISNWAQKNCRG